MIVSRLQHDQDLRRSRKYQVSALRWSDNVQHPGFFHDKRLGKCLIALRFLKRRNIKGPILIVTTTSAFDGWKEDLELERIRNVEELMGTKKQRQDILAENLCYENPVFILNKEGWKALPEIAHVDWFSVILDESRFIANPRSKVSKFFWKNFRDVTHRIILTGTPDFKNKLDYYQQITFLKHGNLPYKDYWTFKNQAFHLVGMYDLIIKKKHSDVLSKAIAKNVHTLLRKDLKVGRTKSYEKRYVTLPKAVQTAYNTAEQEYILEYGGKVIDKTIYAIGSHIHLMRMCGGFIDGEVVHEEKLKDVKYLLENDFLNEQVIIICRFTHEIKFLMAALQKKYKVCGVWGEIDRDTRKLLKDRFNSKKDQIFIAQGSIVAHGVDLSGGETLIFYSQPNGDEIRSQVEDRPITLKDTKNVLVVDILIKNTVDEDTNEGYFEGESARVRFSRAVSRWQ